ncbi:MAG: glycosyltransferase family 2 protein [Undibacterium sp.]|uniref:glycosyltransferase family 2 protein n=1 Tax=Undibacterium sp. TaxID=1914977 RepID=UPI00271F47B1|nr:glycosyltransferase family 2 protein [Undibacterium sp.]MDO8654294.1 glycosyltransferase family 2 protein [Undibacterium sp.]
MSSLTPLVCICIPTYNAEKTIAATLRSVLDQTYSNLKIQVVDNNSGDGTAAIVESFPDERITLYRNSVNVGGEGNFNRCIGLAKGKYTAIYHADDIYEPEMVATQVAFLEQHPQASAVFTEALLIDEFDQLIGEIRQPRDLAAVGPLHHFPGMFKAILKHSNFLICPSVMALTSVYQDEIKSWRGELFGSSADLDVWLRILQRGPVGILPQATMRYRISRSQWSANVRVDTGRSAFFRVVDHYLAQPDVRSLLTADDLMNYQRLERRDQVMRAINALLQDQPEQAATLCPDIFSMSALKAAWQTRRGMAVLALGLYLKMMLSLRCHRLAKASLIHMKRMTNK